MRVFYNEAPPAPVSPPPPATAPVQAPAANPAPVPLWLDSLPEDMRGDPSLQKFSGAKEPNVEVAKAYVNASKLLGKPADSLVEIPLDKSIANLTPMLRKLGAPETAEGYKLAPVEGGHELLGPDKPMSVALTNVAAQAGLLPEQVQVVYAGMVAAFQDAFKAQDAQAAADAEANDKTLREELGGAYDSSLAKAGFVVDSLGLKDVLNGAGLGTNPAVVKAMLKLEGFMQEKPLNPLPGLGQQHSGVLPPYEAEARARSLQQQALNESDPQTRRTLNEQAANFWKMADVKAT